MAAYRHECLAPKKGEDLQDDRRRTARNYTPTEYFLRALWAITRLGWFRLSPSPCWGWRCMLLRTFGATIGARVRVAPTARIFAPWNLKVGTGTSIGDGAIIYNLGRVPLGDDMTISQRAHLCAGTHDYTQPQMQLLKQPITLENDVWVPAEAFVGPNVTLGDRVVVRARCRREGCAARVGGGWESSPDRPNAVTEFVDR